MSESRVTEEQVADWLRSNPDLLTRHPDLLADLRIPHESGAASLIERQVEVLRADNERLQRQLKHLSSVAGENERLMKRLHRLSLALVSAETDDALLERLEDRLCRNFRADAVRLLIDDDARHSGASIARRLPDPRPEWLERLLRTGEPLCGRLTRDKREVVFGSTADGIGSAALVPLAPDSLLAIGATADERFHPDMGTLFLELLRDALRFRLGMDETASERERARA
ncbi:MAG: DUF484 family protein [Candidatus Wenzhouxiangella sp. M2_3B_020]